MQFFKLSAIVALMSAAAVTQAADWNQRATQECARRSWAAIKTSVDPDIQGYWGILPPPIRTALQQAGAVNADNSLVANPTLEQIALIANTLPQGIFFPEADVIVEQCLTNPPTLPTSSTRTSSNPSSTPSSTPSSSSTSTKPSSSGTTSTQAPSGSTSTQAPSGSTSTQGPTDSTSTQSTSTSTYVPPSSTYVPSSTPCTTSTTTPVAPTSTPIKCIPRPHY
ncbi:hypothetical protein GGH94_003767 [Coemansia aciculifera]|uniref:Uncharacterized protein n=1 Tax=Coemansia aciculifera TaxID=417176 RepID=A0A9W8IJE9_9FUNG|nr:hypothetical protein GGH94_003767 [Coemansia aciculifera]KAJ2872835.1 hypothetical protein GGH93_003691 [Coemansia aciculifera]